METPTPSDEERKQPVKLPSKKKKRKEKSSPPTDEDTKPPAKSQRKTKKSTEEHPPATEDEEDHRYILYNKDQCITASFTIGELRKDKISHGRKAICVANLEQDVPGAWTYKEHTRRGGANNFWFTALDGHKSRSLPELNCYLTGGPKEDHLLSMQLDVRKIVEHIKAEKRHLKKKKPAKKTAKDDRKEKYDSQDE